MRWPKVKQGGPPRIVTKKPASVCNERRWCEAMLAALIWDGRPGGKKTKGLSVVKDVKFGQSKLKHGVVHKRTGNDPGLMLNRCPWCVEPILFFEPFTLEQNKVSS